MGWQDLVVFVAVAGALAWLIVDRIRRRRAKAGCGSCVLNPGGKLDPARDASQPAPPRG